MIKAKAPPKIPNLMSVIKNHIALGRYISCLHLEEREKQRCITRQEILHVLRNGFHEKGKDGFDTSYQVWHYAIRGKTVDERDLRVFVSFDKVAQLVIITAYEVGK